MVEDANGLGISVRNIISIFENTTPSESRHPLRSKSFSRSQVNLKRTFENESHNFNNDFSHQDLAEIQHHLKLLEDELKVYKTYSKEEHTYFQTELVSVLSEIVNIEGQDENIPRKKRELILAVRNCNLILTQKLPGGFERKVNKQITKTHQGNPQVGLTRSESTGPLEETKPAPREADDLSSVPPLVKKLKHLFEEKSHENYKNIGLNELSNIKRNTNLRRVRTISGDYCQYRYLPFKDHTSKENIHKDEDLGHRKEKGLKTIFQKQDTISKDLVYKDDDIEQNKNKSIKDWNKEIVKNNNHNESDVELPNIKVSELVKRLERSISNEGVQNIHNLNTYKSETFEEVENEVYQVSEEQHAPNNEIKVMVICEPLIRTSSITEPFEEVSNEKPVSVQNMVRLLENSSDRPKVTVFQRAISQTLPNEVYEYEEVSDGSSSSTSDTVVESLEIPVVYIEEVDDNEISNSPVEGKTNGVAEPKLYYTESHAAVNTELFEEETIDDGEETEDSLIY